MAAKPPKSAALEKHVTTDSILLWILFVILSIGPLIFHVKLIETVGPTVGNTILDSGIKGDIFTYYKLTFLLLGTFALICVFLYKMLAEKYTIPKSFINLPLGIFFVFILFSGVFADYKTISLFGIYNRHEGSIAYLSYLSLFFIASNLVLPVKRLNWLLYTQVPFIVVNALLSLIYFYGINIINSPIITFIMLPSNLPPSGLNPGAYIMTTIANPNYLSGFGAVLATLFFAKAMLTKEKLYKVFDLCLAGLSFASMLSTLSTSGFFTVVVMMPFLVFIGFMSGDRKSSFKTALAGLIAIGCVFLILNSHNPSVFKESVGFFLGSQHLKGTVTTAAPAQTLASASQSEEFKLPPQGWSAGTGRTYIWGKTIELIQARPFLGYGMDTLPYYFPQNDPAKYSGLADFNTIVDKPHNMYLDIAYGSGIPALLALIALLVAQMWMFIRLFKRRLSTKRGAVLACLFAAWTAFLIQGLFNDTTVGTAPSFWVFFGASVSLLKAELANRQILDQIAK